MTGPAAAGWIVAGAALGALFAAGVHRFRRGRRAWTAALVVAAALYVVFAVAAGAGGRWLAVEAAGVLLFAVPAALGAARSAGWLAAGWALHAAWDVALHASGPGAAVAPAAYVWLCVGFDLVAAGWIAGTAAAPPASP